jgi:hypothetical protein
MKIRLHGTSTECTAAAERLCKVLTVLTVSEPYPDRGRSVLVRVYVDVVVPAPGATRTGEPDE